MLAEELILDLESEETRNLFLNKQIHIVCASFNGLTTFGAFANLGGVESEEAEKMADRVNQAKEVGTLYPKLNLTIIPGSKDMETVFERNTWIKYIRDCFKANEEYIKCPVLIFILDFSAETSQLAKNILVEEAAARHDFVFTRSIYYEAY
jgi:hypothetical protein